MYALSLVTALATASVPAAVDVAVLVHPVARGDILGRDDIATEQRAVGGLVVTPKAAIGQEAARDLPAGTALGRSDLIAPRVVKRGASVTLWVRQPGLLISTEGRALASGAQGDNIRVFSLSTNRTLDAVVEGPGAVRVIAP